MTDYYVMTWNDRIEDTEIVASGELEFCSTKFFELASAIENGTSGDTGSVTLASDQTDWEISFEVYQGKPVWEIEHYSPEDYDTDYDD